MDVNRFTMVSSMDVNRFTMASSVSGKYVETLGCILWYLLLVGVIMGR